MYIAGVEQEERIPESIPESYFEAEIPEWFKRACKDVGYTFNEKAEFVLLFYFPSLCSWTRLYIDAKLLKIL